MKKRVLIFIALAACAIVAVFILGPRRIAVALKQRASGYKTVEERLDRFGPAARARLQVRFDRAGVDYPPADLVMVGLKKERRLELWAKGVCVAEYPILGASGKMGPKLKEGDCQVPEGLYLIECLNPNSLFHLSLRLDYPNAYDWEKARLDGRSDPGSDIMIHGSTASIGCLAMGDQAAEDLFVLAADTGLEKISVLLSPLDMRVHGVPSPPRGAPEWVPELYGTIFEALAELEE